MEVANKRTEARELYTTAHGMKASFQPRTSICKDRDNSSTGNDQVITERWKWHFCEALDMKDNMEIKNELIYQGSEVQTEPQPDTKFGK
jgi:hypothetical protein